MTMNFKKFQLLMWKNFRLRRYHWIITLIEFFLPMLVAYGLLKLASNLTSTSTAKKNETIANPITSQDLEGNAKFVMLCYAPNTSALNDFMNNIRANFASMESFNNESQLEYALTQTIGTVIGVYFKNIISDDSLPNKLSYAIRDTDKWNTRDLYPVIPETGPIDKHEYFFKHFASVQFLINKNFIALKTKKQLSNVEFEWFPFPEYTSDESPRALISFGVMFVVILTVLILSVPLISDIIEEKDSGVKELMKITGLSEWMMWISWFVNALIVTFISFTIVTIILKYPFHGEGSEAIHFVPFSILWLFVILYCIANISVCFTFASIFHSTAVASSIFTIAFGVLIFGINYLMTNYAGSSLLKMVTIMPVGAFQMGFAKIRYYEMQGIEFTWSSVSSSENNDSSVSLMFCMFMLILDSVIYFFLAYYITSINPGKFGARKSPLFIFQALDMRKNKVFKELKNLFSHFSNKDTQPLQNLDEKVESEFIETPPPNVEPTIQIKDLHKYYGLVYAVRGANLNIYPGELTALLGHNGAGKTTTMSIMTGLTSPSAGSIHYKNMDIFKNMEAFRRNLGMCPQENRTLPYLSVMDHLKFFGQLKGITEKEATEEANEYLNMMEMQSKKNALAKELSGGMKRKLCLSIALMGKAEVLILDEPTSGMDVQSRRKLWDLLLGMRGERTVIFTTHYMEEADALGDRIAIMNHGVIVCHGTAIFLKKAYGTGYELTITKSGGESNDITKVVKSTLPNATKEFESPTEVVYKLPLTETNTFPKLFRDLESNVNELNIKHMGIAATTMEHVFLKVGGVSIYDQKSARSATVTDSIRESSYLRYLKGLNLAMQQIGSLMRKKFLYTSRNLFGLCSRIVLPTLVALFMLSLLKNLDFTPEPALDLSLTTYPGSMVVIRKNADPSNIYDYLTKYVVEKGGLIDNAEKADMEQELLKDARKDILKYNRNYIMAFELNSTTTKVFSNPPLIHSFPISITTYSNVLLRSLTKNDLYEIETFNHPLLKSTNQQNQTQCSPPDSSFSFYAMWFFALALYTVDLGTYFSLFVNMERIDGFFHVQMMSNVSPLIYWLGTLAFDIAFFLIIMILRIAAFKIMDNLDFLAFDAPLGVFLLILVPYGISGLLFVYITGYLSNSPNASYTLLFIFNFICGIVVSIFYLIDKFDIENNLDTFYAMLFYVAKAVVLLVPSLNFMLLFIKLMVIFNGNIACSFCSEAFKPVCKSLFKEKSYLVFASKENPDGMLLGILFLLFDVVLYSVILSLINMGYVRYWFNVLKNSLFGTISTNNDEGDYDVQQEFNKVQQYKDDHSKRGQVALLVDGLRKNYINWFKPFTAVSNVSFVVEPGECFGLLGVNGAGKTTTFKMLTAEIVPTLGDSSIEGIKMSSDKMQYLSMAGYCPQTNCFIEVLTGREMLTMIAAMRGVSGNANKALVDKWINIIGLEEFQNQRCGTYSGGNKRKLCTAMSLIGDPRVVFLDEPTSGVDPVSRRNLYDVMAQSKEAGQAVILTSHSMEECETLCNRLTIMVAGVMKCIGTTQHLKKRYAQGFSVLIKMNDIRDFDTEVEALKQIMLETFSPEHCILKDEHRGLLYYQIKNTLLPWSTLFENMENIKYNHRELVEDYVLTDTTLEEVFISFAKHCATLN